MNTCIGCGCTDERACSIPPSGCYWLAVDIKTNKGCCSACASHLDQFVMDHPSAITYDTRDLFGVSGGCFFLFPEGTTKHSIAVCKRDHIPVEVTPEDAWLGVMARRALPDIQKRLLNSSNEHDAGCAGLAELVKLIEGGANGTS